ncbi:hypothetical protein Salpa_1002 [Sporomusa sp. KB1]|nr:hypothetical protein Salpa_1002 [Sporomusa sp. KB1]
MICGAPLVYNDQAAEMECAGCHKMLFSHAKCTNGHYICDGCHGSAGVLAIQYACNKTVSKNPLEIAIELMKSPVINMHGPEHHVLVGSALLAAYRNSGGDIDLRNALQEMVKRGGDVPGGICGFWGSCGAAISSGMFISIITKSTPLSTDTWGLSNLMTAEILKKIGSIGGPRCCKRNSFISIKTAARFVKEHLGVTMELPAEIKCTHFLRNNECLGKKCPFFPE